MGIGDLFGSIAGCGSTGQVFPEGELDDLSWLPQYVEIAFSREVLDLPAEFIILGIAASGTSPTLVATIAIAISISSGTCPERASIGISQHNP